MTAAKANGLLLVMSFIWGTGFIGSQIVLDAGITPMQLIAGRFLIATLLLDIVFMKRLKEMDCEIGRAGGFIGFWLLMGFVFQTFGLQHTSPSVNAFVTATYVVMIPFMVWIAFKKRPDHYAIIGAWLTVAGVGLISANGRADIGFGVVLTVVSAICYAFQVSAIDYYTKKYDPVLLSIVMVNVTALGALTLAAVMALFLHDMPAFSIQGLTAMFYLGIFPTALAFIFQNIGQKYTTASRASIIFATESVFAAILSALIYKEVFGVKMLIGGGFVFFAILVSETKLTFFNKHTEHAYQKH